MKTFNVEFLGCKVNAWEIEALREGFRHLGLSEATDGQADIYVLNTCSVTANAGSTSRNRIRRARRGNPDTQVLVTGCYAESDPERIEGIGGIRRIFGNEQKDGIVPFVAHELLGLDADAPLPAYRITRMGDQTRAFVKIEDGCDDNCTFCIIPTLRGGARSRDPDEIVEEVNDLVRSGHHEIVLTGVHIGYFDEGQGTRGSALIRLLRRLARIPGLERLKLSSIEVHEITPELVALFASDPVFAPHFHLPLQAGSDRTLARMRRKYSTRTFRERVAALREHVADPAISTDVIVGFPGETDEDFAETLSFCREMAFMKIHVFPYSVREGTAAAEFPDHVAPEVLDARKHALLALEGDLGARWRAGFVGQDVTVLVEGRRDAHSGWLTGLTDRYLRVHVDGPDRLFGTLVPATVTRVVDGAVTGVRREATVEAS
ncbi:MAG: tRNA (N(6)-L-threonylcarbamoyladenosine(37)-C(2))-methylthiotransferase MtaB [Planctomycetes bacterium]|nr:tRNA (N(6)-L-threonylcarbamoyladenosine(37)-C(2))-methylthiotransferase MtaB [Planctomycetota bacterium]